MSVANQRANTGNDTSAKRQELKAGKTDAHEIKAKGANADKEGSDVKPDPSGDVKATISPLPSDRPTTPEASVTDRISALEEKLNRMQKIIEEQQHTIQLLSGKTAASPVETKDVEATADASTSKTLVENAPVPSGQNAGRTAGASPQNDQDQARKVGPIRWSGDFRLRFDAFFRPASKPPDPPLQHQQNVRMRYRFRLNLDADANPLLSFHGQLSTGTVNNQLTSDQDFTGIVVKHPFFINEAWMDFHPNKNIQLQAGRVQPIFSDGSLFVFDDDIRFNGFNEKFKVPLKNAPGGVTSVEFRAGQYIFSNPVVAIVEKGSPLNLAGAKVGSTGRAANLFHQGFIVDQKLDERWSQQFSADVQLYRNPNQIQLASTQTGVAFLVNPGIGIALSGPITGIGNATTTPGGAIYRAGNFQIGRVTYRINNTGFSWGDHPYPISLYVQLLRNFGTGAHERDGMMATLQVGKWTKRGDMVFTYFFTIKGANALISQFTDDDPGSGSGVNIRVHMLRWDLGLAKNVRLETMAFVRHGLRSSGQYPNFFVPLEAFTPTLYRFQERLLFTF